MFIIKIGKGIYYAHEKRVTIFSGRMTDARSYPTKACAMRVLTRIKNSMPRSNFDGAYVVQVEDLK